jgi:hypothetical protein
LSSETSLGSYLNANNIDDLLEGRADVIRDRYQR